VGWLHVEVQHGIGLALHVGKQRQQTRHGAWQQLLVIFGPMTWLSMLWREHASRIKNEWSWLNSFYTGWLTGGWCCASAKAGSLA